MKSLATQRALTFRYYGSRIESIESSLFNINATLNDSFISGSDRAKLLIIESLRLEIKKEIEFIESTYNFLK